MYVYIYTCTYEELFFFFFFFFFENSSVEKTEVCEIYISIFPLSCSSFSSHL